MNLAVIAAFTAAAISLVNIIVTARLTSGSQFRKWQREEARPITARLLTLSREARGTWQQIAFTRRELLDVSDGHSRAEGLQKRQRDQLAAGWAVVEKLNFEEATLWLMATPPTREAALALINKHGGIETALEWHPDYIPGKELDELLTLEETLSAKFRADLGLPRDRNWLRRIRKNLP